MRHDNSQWAGHRLELLRYVDRRVADRALSEDIAQEAITKLLAYDAKPGNQVANVTALLRRIALDLTRDHFRRCGRSREAELTEETPCPQISAQQRLEKRQQVEIVLGVLGNMPPLRREAFLLRRIDGQPSKQAAAILGISPGAVDAHMARAVFDLHMALEKIERRDGYVRG